MDKNIRIIYYAVSIIFLILIIGLFGFRINSRINKNLASIEENFENLKLSALSTYLAEGSFDSEYFMTNMKTSFGNADRMLLLAIYSGDDGLRYLLTKNKNYLVSPLGEDPAWQGTPEYRFNSILEVKLSSSFAPGIQRNLYIDGIFERISRADLYPILREALYVILVYLLITGIILLILTTAEKQKPAESKSCAPRAAVDSGTMLTEPGTDSRQPGSSLFSPETGLSLKEHLDQRLGFELKRAASFDQDLALIIIALDHSTGDPDLKYIHGQLGKLIRESFPFMDLAFEYGEDTYAIILPDRDLDQALKDAEQFKAQVDSSDWADQNSISIGVSARRGRLISEKRLLIEAGKSLQKAFGEGGNQIIAFRADPDKFRKVLTSS
ncbi:hypothetical protein ES703_27373 [subsurface metagenome]